MHMPQRYFSAALLAIVALCASKQVDACTENGRTYSNGEEWKDGNFIMRCKIHEDDAWETEVAACVHANGRRIPINTSMKDHNSEWKCQKNENGGVTLVKGTISNIDCGGRSVGETWVEKNRFTKKCKSNGAIEVVNCISKDGYHIPLNGELIKNGLKYRCDMTTQGSVRFEERPVEDE